VISGFILWHCWKPKYNKWLKTNINSVFTWIIYDLRSHQHLLLNNTISFPDFAFYFDTLICYSCWRWHPYVNAFMQIWKWSQIPEGRVSSAWINKSYTIPVTLIQRIPLWLTNFGSLQHRHYISSPASSSLPITENIMTNILNENFIGRKMI
jgi:hypothetical protein